MLNYKEKKEINENLLQHEQQPINYNQVKMISKFNAYGETFVYSSYSVRGKHAFQWMKPHSG